MVLCRIYVEVVSLIQFIIIIMILFPKHDLAIFHENAGFFKKLFYLLLKVKLVIKMWKNIWPILKRKSSWIIWCLIFKDIFIRTKDISTQRMIPSKICYSCWFQSLLKGVYGLQFQMLLIGLGIVCMLVHFH